MGGGLAQSRERLNLRLCFLKKGRLMQESNFCSCSPAEKTLIDLGPGYYPRFLASFQCDSIPCLNPPNIICDGMTYKVQVLKSREAGDAVDHSLPDSLKAAWKFVHVPVNVGCICGV
ncbi:Prothoracicotropic hormone [Nesidiocoris tenuis]|uniref:Prothoracicotropic hormone n=1 Tax=Nesidiocoris tenuis TaxID=355587 RepID=A0ABN7AKZ6_9HEMI|nr:Prothoracicotropic hormone [Nesidiocoris tenuis]